MANSVAEPTLGTQEKVEEASARLSVLDSLRQRNQSFQLQFINVATMGLGASSLIVAFAFLMLQRDLVMLVTALVAVAVCFAANVLARYDRLRLGAYVFVHGFSWIVLMSTLLRPVELTLAAGTAAFLWLTPISGFLLGVRSTLVLAALQLGMLVSMYVVAIMQGGGQPAQLVTVGIFVATLLLAQVAVVALFVKEASENQTTLWERLVDIERVVGQARRVAKGDLSGTIEGESDVSQVVASMVQGLRSLVDQIRETSATLASAAREISAMARQQEQGALQQAGAVQEIRATLESLVASSRDIASSAGGVVSIAESSLDNNESIESNIRLLATHTQGIADILEIIKDVANKSELLALNASLEGAKAGETGRGFSLVADQMQRLAENVMSSVKDVKKLTLDIREATGGAVTSTEKGTKMAFDATQAARQISVITQQQKSSTEQASQAMEDISLVAREMASGSSQAQAAAEDLVVLSKRLHDMVNSFQT